MGIKYYKISQFAEITLVNLHPLYLIEATNRYTYSIVVWKQKKVLKQYE